jgi:hypothetical protein
MRNRFILATLASFGLLSIASAAQAATIVADPIKASDYSAAQCSQLGGSGLDRAFECLKVKGAITEKWVAESRIGGPSTWEVGISKANAAGAVSMATDASGNALNKNLEWTNGSQYQFSLTFNAATSKVTYSVGNQTLTWTADNGSVSDLLIRTRGGLQAGAADGSTSSVDLLNLSILNQGQTTTWAKQSSSIADAADGQKPLVAIANIDYLRVGDLKGDFTLTGTSVFSWSGQGSRPTNSNLAYQIKAISTPNSTPIPEPASLGALAIGGLVIARRKRSA